MACLNHSRLFFILAARKLAAYDRMQGNIRTSAYPKRCYNALRACSSSVAGRSLTASPISRRSTMISEDQVKQFEENGAIVLRGLFGPDLLESLRAAGEENMKNPGPLCDEHVQPGQPGRFHDDQFLWLRHNAMRKFIFESPAATIAKAIMRGQQVRLFYDHLLIKEPGTETKTPWHNDHSYWQVNGDVVSIWVALDSIPSSACVQYVKGSHKWRLKHRISSFSGDQKRYQGSPTEEIPDIDSMGNEIELLKWDMEPGDCLLHHSYTIHGAPGISVQSGRRRGYVTRWIAKDAVFDPRPGTMHYLWINAGLEPKLEAGGPFNSDLFPLVD